MSVDRVGSDGLECVRSIGPAPRRARNESNHKPSGPRAGLEDGAYHFNDRLERIRPSTGRPNKRLDEHGSGGWGYPRERVRLSAAHQSDGTASGIVGPCLPNATALPHLKGVERAQPCLVGKVSVPQHSLKGNGSSSARQSCVFARR